MGILKILEQYGARYHHHACNLQGVTFWRNILEHMEDSKKAEICCIPASDHSCGILNTHCHVLRSDRIVDDKLQTEAVWVIFPSTHLPIWPSYRSLRSSLAEQFAVRERVHQRPASAWLLLLQRAKLANVPMYEGTAKTQAELFVRSQVILGIDKLRWLNKTNNPRVPKERKSKSLHAISKDCMSILSPPRKLKFPLFRPFQGSLRPTSAAVHGSMRLSWAIHVARFECEKTLLASCNNVYFEERKDRSSDMHMRHSLLLYSIAAS
jgi:hypothetical protein